MTLAFLKEKTGKEIGINTIKIAGAAMAAILLAVAMKLEFAVSAGIVAILTIQPT